jgi:transcription-repair coupling factor (superfamily II helicase)
VILDDTTHGDSNQTVVVGDVGDDVGEVALRAAFSTFGTKSYARAILQD